MIEHKVTICKEYIVEADNEGEARHKGMTKLVFDIVNSGSVPKFKIKVDRVGNEIPI